MPALIMLETWPLEEKLHLAALAKHLGPDLIAIGPPAGDALPTSAAGWVDHFEARLADLPIAGPYYLFGWSFGGVVALELARRLRSEGRSIAFVGMIDSWRPSREPKGARPYLEYHLAQLLDLPRNARRSHVAKMMRRALRHRKARVRRWARRAAARLRILAPARVMPPAQRAIQISYLKYQLTRYDGVVSIYACQETIALHGGDQSLGWSKWLTAGFEQVTLPGGHRSVFDSGNVAVLAAALERSVRRARDDLPAGYEMIPAPLASVGPGRPGNSSPA